MTLFGPASALFLFVPELLLGAVFLVILLVVVFYTGRREPDPRGRRPYAAFLFSLTFAGVAAALAASGFATSAIAGAVSHTGGYESCSFEPVPAGEGFSVPPAFSRVPFPIPTLTVEVRPAPTFSLPSPEFSIEIPTPAYVPAGTLHPQRAQCVSADSGRRARGIRAGIYLVAAGGLALGSGRAARELLSKEETDG